MALFSEEQKREMSRLYHETLQHDKYNGFICPVCGSGSGKQGTGMAARIENDGKWHYTCFACSLDRPLIDCFELEGIIHNTSDFRQQAEYVMEKIGQTFRPDSNVIEKKPYHPVKQQPRERQDFTEFYKEANRALNDRFEFLKNKNWLRGLSLKTLNHFNMGYLEWHYVNPKTGKENKGYTPKLIVPIKNYCYLERDMRSIKEIRAFTSKSPNPEETFNKIMNYSKQKRGGSDLYNIFNPKRRPALSTVWILEAEIDSASLYEADQKFHAVGLGSISNAGKLIRRLQRDQDFYRQYRYLVALDNDEAGKAAGKQITEWLKEIGLDAVYLENGWKDCKDPNEYLMKHGRTALKELLEKQLEGAGD